MELSECSQTHQNDLTNCDSAHTWFQYEKCTKIEVFSSSIAHTTIWTLNLINKSEEMKKK